MKVLLLDVSFVILYSSFLVQHLINSYNKVRRCLDFGIRVGDRTFLPLAYSASQVRTHALWGIAFVNKKFTRGRVSTAFFGLFEKKKKKNVFANFFNSYDFRLWIS